MARREFAAGVLEAAPAPPAFLLAASATRLRLLGQLAQQFLEVRA